MYGKADINLNLVVNNMGGVFSVNGEPPTVPVLLHILSGAHDVTDLMPDGNVIVPAANKVVELTMVTNGFGPSVSDIFSVNNHSWMSSTSSTVLRLVHAEAFSRSCSTPLMSYNQLFQLSKSRAQGRCLQQC